MSTQKDLLNVGIKKGTFYLSQDYPTPGEEQLWEKQEFKNPQTGADMVKYHKKISIEGNLVYLAMRDDKFKGMCLNVIVGGETESYSLQIPIMNTGGKVEATNEYFNSLVGVLEKLEKGDYVKMFVNNKNEDKNGRLYRNIVVLDEAGRLIKSDFSFQDIPNWESTSKTDAFGREVKTWDASKANAFLIGKFKATADKWEAARLAKKEGDAQEQGETPAQTPKTQTPPATPATDGVVDDHDDLPF